MEAIFNQHKSDFGGDFTIEFNVKNPNLEGINEEVYEHELITGTFTNSYGEELFDKIRKIIGAKTWLLNDWSFAGRSNGWYVLICTGEMSKTTDKQLGKLETVVEQYFKNYGTELKAYYNI